MKPKVKVADQLIPNIIAHLSVRFGEKLTFKDIGVVLGGSTLCWQHHCKHLSVGGLVNIGDFASWVVSGNRRLTQFSIVNGDPSQMGNHAKN